MTSDTLNTQSLRTTGDSKNADRLTESLKEQKRRLGFAEKIAHTGSLEWYTLTGRMIWSDELYRILGFDPGSFAPVYRDFTGILHPYDAERVPGLIQEAFRAHGPFDAEFRIVRPDKTVRDVHMAGEVYYDAQGRPLKMNAAVQDITGRVLIEKRLEAQNRELLRFTAAIDGMDDLVILTDNAGVIDYVNRSCEKTLGCPQEKIRGRHISEFRDPAPGFELRREVFIDDPKSTWTGTLNLVNRQGMTVRTLLKSTPVMQEHTSLGRLFVLRVQF